MKRTVNEVEVCQDPHLASRKKAPAVPFKAADLPPKTALYHLRLDNINSDQALRWCRLCLYGDKPKSIFFVNAHCFNLSLEDENYLHVLNHSDLLLNDGIGIKIASKLMGVRLPENMNGTDFIPKVLALAAEENKRVFLLGSRPGIAEIAQRELEEQYPDLNICGTRSGYFNADQEQQVIDEINRSRAEVIIVGMGVPTQEKWIFRNKSKFTHARLLVAGGAIIDFSAGCVVRAPTLIQMMGLEWLFRFVQEPRRLFHRYFIGNWRFVHHIFYNR